MSHVALNAGCNEILIVCDVQVNPESIQSDSGAGVRVTLESLHLKESFVYIYSIIFYFYFIRNILLENAFHPLLRIFKKCLVSFQELLFSNSFLNFLIFLVCPELITLLHMRCWSRYGSVEANLAIVFTDLFLLLLCALLFTHVRDTQEANSYFGITRGNI